MLPGNGQIITDHDSMMFPGNPVWYPMYDRFRLTTARGDYCSGCLQLLWLQIWDLFETFFRQIWDHSRGFYVIDLMRIELLRQIIFQSPSLFKLVSLYSWATKTQERTIRTFHSYQWDINYFIFQMDGIQIAFFGTRSGGYRWIGWLNALKNTYR